MTRRWLCIVVVMLCCLLAVVTSASGGFITGNQWRELPNSARMLCVVGVIDGWHFMGLAVDEPSKQRMIGTFIRLTSCVEKRQMTGEQILAIVEKYVTEHPEEWHERMEFIVFKTMSAACK
jgi:hypothetical protein